MDATNLPSIRLLGEWMEKNGVGLAFIAVTMVLLFCFFLKKIFTKENNEARLEEIRDLLIEAKVKLDLLLKKEIEK